MKKNNKKIVAIGSHPDDIEIGCGGAIALHAEAGDEVVFLIMTKGEKDGSGIDRTKEAKEAANLLGAKSCEFLGFKDTEIPSGRESVDALEAHISKLSPDRVYIPYFNEIHQDHRNTAFAALAACRNVPQILMYQGPSSFPDFKEDFWINIDKTIEKKIEAIRCHLSQGKKEILKLDAIKSLNHAHGYQTRCGYAEAFSVFRFVESI